jgi:putative endonuclease
MFFFLTYFEKPSRRATLKKRKLNMFWVYILKCLDNSYYIGHTENLENRLMQHYHNIYPTCYTATRLPVRLVFSQEFATREEALSSERQIKGWSRKKKEALIKGDWKALSMLAKRSKAFV